MGINSKINFRVDIEITELDQGTIDVIDLYDGNLKDVSVTVTMGNVFQTGIGKIRAFVSYFLNVGIIALVEGVVQEEKIVLGSVGVIPKKADL